ncbi:MAG: hypothetical protein Q4D38_01195 [Planctomycetia bacterium]|nr:hypothetical protein [Planctomycetia bacterium]
MKLTDAEKTALVGCTTACVAVVREHFVQRGLQKTMDGLLRKPRGRVPDGDQEARIVELRLGELGIVESVGRQTLYKL